MKRLGFFALCSVALGCGRSAEVQHSKLGSPAMTGSSDVSLSASSAQAPLTPPSTRKILRGAWPGRANSSVEVAFDELDEFSAIADLNPILRVEGPQAPSVTPIALQVEPADSEWRYSEPTFSIDGARFALLPGVSALGVRFSCATEFPGGHNTTEWLHLYMLHFNELVDVFHVVIASDDIQRGPNEATSERSIVQILDTKTGGFADLLVKTTTVRGEIFDDAPTHTERTRTRYVWAGKGYVRAE